MLQEIRSRNFGLGFRAKEVVRASPKRVGSGLSRIRNPAAVEDGLLENFIPDQSPTNASEKHTNYYQYIKDGNHHLLAAHSLSPSPIWIDYKPPKPLAVTNRNMYLTPQPNPVVRLAAMHPKATARDFFASSKRP